MKKFKFSILTSLSFIAAVAVTFQGLEASASPDAGLDSLQVTLQTAMMTGNFSRLENPVISQCVRTGVNCGNTTTTITVPQPTYPVYQEPTYYNTRYSNPYY